MTDGRLLIPAPEAAQKLGISRRSLRNRIDAGVVKSVQVGARVYIHKAELERIVNGRPKPEAPEEISLTGKGAEGPCQNGHTLEIGCEGKTIAECQEMFCLCDWINTARQKTR
jgi:excisionase family DNA binding protein